MFFRVQVAVNSNLVAISQHIICFGCNLDPKEQKHKNIIDYTEVHTSLSPPKLAPDKNPSLSAKFANPIPRARPRVVKKTWSFILPRHKLLSVRYGSPQGPTNSHTSGEDADSTEPNPNPSHKLKARTGAKQLSSIGVEATTYTRLPPREDFSLPSLDSSSLEFSSEVKLSESNRA
ncbi:hypothetical protein GBA52_004320 [Prunus armeniaca]|nr:hypothetical protein GBA52_004320 [Prunus armeniaca]